MAATNAPAVRNAPAIVCGNVTSTIGLASTARKSVSSARPAVWSIVKPTGCCIQALAARMKYADSTVPTAAIQMVARWIHRGRRSQPKIHRPRKVDSRKNASRPSMASGAPKMSPTKRL